MNSNNDYSPASEARPAGNNNVCLPKKIPEGSTKANSESITEKPAMQITKLSKLLICLGDPSKFRMVARLDPAPGELVETLETIFEKAVYSRRMNAILIKIQSTIITIYASGIVTMTRLGNADQARELLNDVVDRINRSAKEMDLKLLHREHESRKHPDPMELTAYLPRTNCMQCGMKSCFYFSTMLAYSEATLEKCKLLQETHYYANREVLERLMRKCTQR
jgi:ArsR family metal-binding transcriptional regulator